MENEHVPVSNHTSSTNGDALSKTAPDMADMEDTVEFRILMAYAQRRHRTRSDKSENASDAPSAEGAVEKKKKKMKWLSCLTSCVKPQSVEEGDSETSKRCLSPHDDAPKGMNVVVSQLTTIADQIPFTPPEIEADCDDNVEKLIGLLLRKHGDEFNEILMKDVSLTSELRQYGFFESLISTFLERMGFATFGNDALGPEELPKNQMALTCEVTSRLLVVDTLPTARLMGFGATYMRNHYSAWASQQGGYEGAFDCDSDQEVN